MKVELISEFGYFQASVDERKNVSNGCGTAGWKGKLVPDTVCGMNLRPSCDIHDWDYEFSPATNEGKKKADRTFLNNNIRIANATKTRWWERFTGGKGFWHRRRLNLAHIYYDAVKKFGGPAFWESKNKKEYRGSV